MSDLMTASRTPAEIVAHWFKLVGVGSNEPLYLNVEPGKVFISDAAGEVATLSTDWDQLMEAATMAELAELVQRDIDEYEACDEEG